MTNLTTVVKGMMTFFTAFFISLILYYVIPPIVEIFTNDTHSGISWLVIILVWIVGMVILPMGIIISGLREQEQQEGSIFGISAGVLFFLFAILLTVFGWFMITSLSGMIEEPLLKVIFWIGLLANWILAVIVTPAVKITNASKNF